MRTAKLKTPGNIAASIEHTFRERDTPNADRSRTHLNEHHGPSNTADLLDKLNEMIPEQRRKDAVLCVEHFFGASPEWWAKASRDDQKAFFRRAEGWLNDTYGRENVAYFGTQMDEQTPHAVAYVVPLRDGKLNAKSWLGGKERLQGLQATFAESVKDLGLQRGVEGSKAKHERVARFYGVLDQADQRAERSAQALKLSMGDRLDVALGKTPRTIERALEWTVDQQAKAKLTIETAAKRAEQRGYQRGVKDVPQLQAQLDADRERLKREQERAAAAEKKLEQQRETLEKERSEFELNKVQAGKNLLRRVGLHIAERGNEYVGQIASLTKDFALQITEEFGVVLHQISSWSAQAHDKLRGLFQRDEPAKFEYYRDGKVSYGRAEQIDLQRERERMHEERALGTERDGYDLGR